MEPKMMTQKRQPSRSALRRLGDRVRGLIRSEDGNLFITFLPMLGVMMLWGGIAVDLMRFESRRAQLQNVTDRATLAAANLTNKVDATTLVRDYFAKSGVSDSLKSVTLPSTNNATFREVEVQADFSLPTLFLRHVNNIIFEENNDQDWTKLSAPADATAVEGVSSIEVSLVLDLSGSMYAFIPGTSQRRIDKLKTAASGFIDKLLLPDYANRMSISLVPYSEQVNIGPLLFDKLNVARQHNFSHCIEFPASAFSSTTFNRFMTYDQTQAVQFNTFGKGGFDSTAGSTRNQANPTLDQPVCPRQIFEQVIPISQKPDVIKAAIQKFEPRSGTSIFLGLKWGVSLLDPSFRPIIQQLPRTVIDEPFANRPLDYDREGGRTFQVRNLKYLVLMTDGYNDFSFRMKDEYYDDPSERLYWATHNLPWVEMDNRVNAPGAAQTEYKQPTYFYTRDQGVGYMRSMCKAARDAGIVVYAISMSGNDTSPEAASGRTEMSNCAGDSSRFFVTSGPELDQIFAQIARQITALRLTQ